MATNGKKEKPEVVRSITNSSPENHGALGKRIEFGARTHVTKNKAGMKVEFFTPTIQSIVGIGKDHVAYLIMDEDAWVALKKGQKLNIDSLQGFQKKFIK